MPNACNGSVSWVTWDYVSGPTSVRWNKKRRPPPQGGNGDLPSTPPGLSQDDGKAHVQQKARAKAAEWSEPPKVCDRDCKTGPDVPSQSEFDIVTYADSVQQASTDALNRPWFADYQATGDVKYRKIVHLSQCYPSKAGLALAIVIPESGVAIPEALLARLDAETQLELERAAESLPKKEPTELA